VLLAMTNRQMRRIMITDKGEKRRRKKKRREIKKKEKKKGNKE
jgi:hypothetical protein